MTGAETVLTQLARLVVVPAVKHWLAERQRRASRELPLQELVNRRFTDDVSRRRFSREVDSMIDAVAERLRPLASTRFSNLEPHESEAALAAVGDTLKAADLSDAAIFATNADGQMLAKQLRKQLPRIPEDAGLTGLGRRLYDTALEECCITLVSLMAQLPAFSPRVDAELLSRTSKIIDELQELSRLASVTASEFAGRSLRASEFRQIYLDHIAKVLNEVELFGVDIHHYRPRTTISVAYISLAVTTEAGRSTVRSAWDAGALRRPAAEPNALRVEQVLADRTRILLRGDAGSGKTTLLRWLAVTTARNELREPLLSWRDSTPFLVKLRSYAGVRLPSPESFLDGVADTIADLKPSGWVHNELQSGRALLLVDGVDELPAAQRVGVQTWLRGLLAQYPHLRIVVTSRPSAAEVKWLADLGFASASLERMSPGDVRQLIRHWHEAILDAGDLPCPPAELARYENALISRLDLNPHLQVMSTNPMLCAMLCALNLDRETHLPRDRMALYQAAVDLLLERRDMQRSIPATMAGLVAREKLQLLQYLAWRLSINNAVEQSKATATKRLAERVAIMPQVTTDARSLLDHLLQRSGLLREPVLGRIDFVHKSIQEYLTAREAAEQGDTGLLIDRAHLDSWHDIVVMAAGHGNAVVRRELLTGILDRAAAAKPELARTLRLLAAACLETVPSLDPPLLLTRVNREFGTLLPPRDVNEAPTLAKAGEPLLRHLDRDPREMSAAEAAASARAIALVNGGRALRLLANYAADPRAAVQRELIRAWHYFDPDEYAATVMARAPWNEDGILSLDNPSAAMLQATRHLDSLREIHVRFAKRVNLRCLDGVPRLARVAIDEGIDGDLGPVAAHAGLRVFDGYFDGQAVDLEPLRALSNLEFLNVWLVKNIPSIDFIGPLKALGALELGYVNHVSDFSPIRDRHGVQRLQLHGWPGGDVSGIVPGPDVTMLCLYETRAPRGGLMSIVQAFPNLEHLTLNGCRWVDDLSPLKGLGRLKTLRVMGIPDLSFQAFPELTSVEELSCGDTEYVHLGPVAAAGRLTKLVIGPVLDEIDLSVFAGRSIDVTVDEHQQVTKVPGTVRLTRISWT